MTDARATQALREAIERYGAAAFTRPRAGSALVADMVGGLGTDLYEHARVLAAVCEARASGTDPASIEEEIARASRVDAPRVRWAMRVFDGLIGELTPPVETTVEPTIESPDPIDAVDPDSPLHLAPVVLVVALVILLVVVVLVI